MDDCYIDIVSNKGINYNFIKANRYILKKYFKKLNNLDLLDKKHTLERLWQKEFGAKLIKEKNNTHWSKIVFPCRQSYLMFILKWE
jgi:hypothetical protein